MKSKDHVFFKLPQTITKTITKLRAWAPINDLHSLERYIAHYVTYKDYAPLGWVVGGPELPGYTCLLTM